MGVMCTKSFIAIALIKISDNSIFLINFEWWIDKKKQNKEMSIDFTQRKV